MLGLFTMTQWHLRHTSLRLIGYMYCETLTYRLPCPDLPGINSLPHKQGLSVNQCWLHTPVYRASRFAGPIFFSPRGPVNRGLTVQRHTTRSSFYYGVPQNCKRFSDPVSLADLIFSQLIDSRWWIPPENDTKTHYNHIGKKLCSRNHCIMSTVLESLTACALCKIKYEQNIRTNSQSDHHIPSFQRIMKTEMYLFLLQWRQSNEGVPVNRPLISECRLPLEFAPQKLQTINDLLFSSS